MSSRDKNLPYEILTLSHFGFKYCSVCTVTKIELLQISLREIENKMHFRGIYEKLLFCNNYNVIYSKAAFTLSHGTLFTRNCIFVYMYYGKAAVSSLPGSAAAVPCGLAARAVVPCGLSAAAAAWRGYAR